MTPLSRFPQGKPITPAEGVLFSTYATLRSDERAEKVSRFRQIVDGLGSDFDGVTIFDESHATQNAGGEKSERGDVAPSQQERAGLRLQHALPDARIVCVSATGAQTRLLTITENRRNRPTLLDDALACLGDGQGKLLANARSGRAAAQVSAPSIMLDDGEIERRVRLIRFPVDQTGDRHCERGNPALPLQERLTFDHGGAGWLRFARLMTERRLRESLNRRSSH